MIPNFLYPKTFMFHIQGRVLTFTPAKVGGILKPFKFFLFKNNSLEKVNICHVISEWKHISVWYTSVLFIPNFHGPKSPVYGYFISLSQTYRNLFMILPNLLSKLALETSSICNM